MSWHNILQEKTARKTRTEMLVHSTCSSFSPSVLSAVFFFMKVLLSSVPSTKFFLDLTLRGTTKPWIAQLLATVVCLFAEAVMPSLNHCKGER